ncbi:disease resistance protein (TIR-NBS-LRR class) [Abeliophyllum distichum]|uniref:Disease resistance protein (TIR-NBS-LRR class) n=1 Tax=Abeliophyllum distichum TaxID=126358 RepID=A0ABD1W0S0_9LAMI
MSALHTLILDETVIIELPESIGMLENLTVLRLDRCKKLCKLPASFGNLKNLRQLFMEDTAITELPETFGMLSNLRTFKMAKKPELQVHHISGTSEPATSVENEGASIFFLKSFLVSRIQCVCMEDIGKDT